MSRERNSAPYDAADYIDSPEMAAEFLNAAIEEGDERVMLSALRAVIRKVSTMREVAAEAHMHRESLSRMLSADGNPRFDNLVEVLHACGFEMRVQPRRPKRDECHDEEPAAKV